MIDPVVSLAFALEATPGAYALLLGSGVSRSAQVPTGWEVVLDLARRLADAEGEAVGDDAATWYEAKFGASPSYSELLDSLARTPAERQALLRGYFEPTPEEREQGIKVPTAGHRAIARLVRQGVVRVIVTTNFDRLTETAIEDEGVTPIIIATPDMALGAPPLAHAPVTVLKLHGDYLDTRIRNTPDELAAYDDATNRLLDRIFDEYGLIVCGWSGEWDQALRDAIARCATHRYSTYWAARREPTGLAADLIQVRRAVFLPIVDADSLFVGLDERVSALRDVNARHPASAALAVATLKRYLPESRHLIRLSDLVRNEVEEVVTVNDALPLTGSIGQDDYLRRMAQAEAMTSTLANLLAVGGYWGKDEHDRVWLTAIERLAARPTRSAWNEALLGLRDYPTTIAYYALGMGAMAADRWRFLTRLMGDIDVADIGREREPLIFRIPPGGIINEPFLQPATGGRRYTPASDRLHDSVLREPLREVLTTDERFTERFDDFEYVVSLVYADRQDRRRRGGIWAPYGSWAWRSRRDPLGAPGRLATKLGAGWREITNYGLFDGSPERLTEVKAAFDELVNKSGPW